jgi:hypothetical protein
MISPFVPQLDEPVGPYYTFVDTGSLGLEATFLEPI